MEELFISAWKIIGNLLTSFTTVTTSLLSNEIFQIMFGIIVLYLGIEFVMYLVKKTRQNKIDRPYKRATGMTKEEFYRDFNRRYAEKFSYENKKKHLGLK